MNTPKISIIVPIYNVEQYLDECIESIRRQTYRNLQIVLIDDGSTDLSGKICDKHALEDDRIVVVHQENQGVSVARKIGLKLADGEYIGFVDSDDYIEPQMYESMMLTLVKENADMVQTWAEPAYRCEYKVIDLDTCRMDALKCFIGGAGKIKVTVDPNLWTKLFKEKIVKEAYEFVDEDVFFGEDLVCICAVLFIASRICTMDEKFYHYRIRENSIAHSISAGNVSREVRLYVNVCDVLKKMNVYDELKREMDSFLINHIFRELKRYGISWSKYYFPSPEKLQNKRILLYGAGAVGNDYYSQISRYTNCDIVAWVDAHPGKYNYSFVKLYGLDSLLEMTYDIVLVAVKDRALYEQIEKSLFDKLIPKEKIMWEKPIDITVEE